MPLLPSRTPNQLFAQALCGVAVAASGFIVTGLRYDYFNSHVAFFSIVLFGAIAIGFILSFNAETELTNGIAAERWTDAQVQRVRNLVQNPAWIIFMIALPVTTCVLVCLPSHHLRGYGWACMLAGQAMSRLSIALRQPTPSGPRTNIFSDMKPITSDHWGNR